MVSCIQSSARLWRAAFGLRRCPAWTRWGPRGHPALEPALHGRVAFITWCSTDSSAPSFSTRLGGSNPAHRSSWSSMGSVARQGGSAISPGSQPSSSQSNRADLTPSLRFTRWSTGSDNTEVQLYELGVGGHDWPRHLGDETRTTAEVIWRFFDGHRPRSR